MGHGGNGPCYLDVDGLPHSLQDTEMGGRSDVTRWDCVADALCELSMCRAALWGFACTEGLGVLVHGCFGDAPELPLVAVSCSCVMHDILSELLLMIRV